MTMDATLLYNSSNLEPFIGHDAIEYPLALQLGGSDPFTLSEAAYLCESYGSYSEINLNAGCPSNKAKKGGFGAELMLDPDLVRRIVMEMKRKVTHTEVTVKCRIGVTGRDSWDELLEFVHAVREGGVRHMIIHARHCVLAGLSPAQNRSVPPLRYDIVHDLVREFPEMTFTLNGGIRSFREARNHLNWATHSDYDNGVGHGHIAVGKNGGGSTGISSSILVSNEYDSYDNEARLVDDCGLSPAVNNTNRTVFAHGTDDDAPTTTPNTAAINDNDTVGSQSSSSSSKSVNAAATTTTAEPDDIGNTTSEKKNTRCSPVVNTSNNDITDTTTAPAADADTRLRALQPLSGSMWGYPVHSVMIGREAYSNPWLFATADSDFYSTKHQRQEGTFGDENKVTNFNFNYRPATTSFAASDHIINSYSDNNGGSGRSEPISYNTATTTNVKVDNNGSSSSSGSGSSSSSGICKSLASTKREALEAYIAYAERCQDLGLYGSNMCNIMKPLHNFFSGCPNNQLYKRKLDELLKIYSANANASRTKSGTVSSAREGADVGSVIGGRIVDGSSSSSTSGTESGSRGGSSSAIFSCEDACGGSSNSRGADDTDESDNINNRNSNCNGTSDNSDDAERYYTSETISGGLNRVLKGQPVGTISLSRPNGSQSTSFADIVWAAVEGTIPLSCLDSEINRG